MSTSKVSSPEPSASSSPKKENPWSNVDSLSMNEEQKKFDKGAALYHAMEIYDELRWNDRTHNLNGMRNKEIAQLCAEDALDNNKGRSIAAVYGADQLGEMVWEHFNEKNWWTWPGRD
jgi:hypothetical protein